MKNSMVFTVWDTHCPLWSKVVFCIHFGLILELLWEPGGTFVSPNVSLGAFLRSRRAGRVQGRNHFTFYAQKGL